MRGRNSSLVLLLALALVAACGPSKEERQEEMESAIAEAMLKRDKAKANHKEATVKRHERLAKEVEKLKSQLAPLEQKLLDYDAQTEKLIGEVEKDISSEEHRFEMEREKVRHENAMELLRIEQMSIKKEIDYMERLNLESAENARHAHEKANCDERHEAKQHSLEHEREMIRSARETGRLRLERELEPERSTIMKKIAEDEKIISQ